jgi:hypothetical protein
MPPEAFDIRKFFKGFVNPTTWSKTIVYLIIGSIIFFMLVCVKNFFFPPKKMVNKPVAVVLPFAKVEKGAIDQSNTQISLDEKLNEVGLYGGGLRYDNKDGVFVGASYKRKF